METRWRAFIRSLRQASWARVSSRPASTAGAGTTTAVSDPAIEVQAADSEPRSFVAEESRRLLGERGFPDGVAAALSPDAASQARASEVIRPAFEALADLAPDA